MNLAKKKGIDRKELIKKIGSEFPKGKGVEDISNKTIYFISVPEENERVIFEACGKSGKTIAKKLLIME